MKLVCAVVALCLGPIGAFAQDLPGAFYVSGVASDDVLNVRAAPDAGATILDTISPFATSIEVLELSADGAWGLVSAGEGNGWAAMRFLEAATGQDPNLIPRPMTCLGTEPFWSVGLLPRGAEFTTPEGRSDLTVVSEAAAPQGFMARLDEGPTLNRTLMITRGQCSDGMSDRRFGWAATLFTESPEGNSALTGCCTLDLR
jgi:uncharacterized membrane protein